MFLVVPFVVVVVVSFMPTFSSADGARSFHIFLALLSVPALLSLFRVSLSVFNFRCLEKTNCSEKGFREIYDLQKLSTR